MWGRAHSAIDKYSEESARHRLPARNFHVPIRVELRIGADKVFQRNQQKRPAIQGRQCAFSDSMNAGNVSHWQEDMMIMSFICSCRNKKYIYVNNAVFPVLLLSFLASNTHVATFAENENYMTIARTIDEEKNWNGIYLALYTGESQEFRVWPPGLQTTLSMDAGLVRTSVCRGRIGNRLKKKTHLK